MKPNCVKAFFAAEGRALRLTICGLVLISLLAGILLLDRITTPDSLIKGGPLRPGWSVVRFMREGRPLERTATIAWMEPRAKTN